MSTAELIELVVTNGLGYVCRAKNHLYREDDLDLQIELSLMNYATSTDPVEKIDTLIDIMYMAYLREAWKKEQDENLNLKCCFKWPGDVVAVVYGLRERKASLPDKYRLPKEHFGWDKENEILKLPSIKVVKSCIRS